MSVTAIPIQQAPSPPGIAKPTPAETQQVISASQIDPRVLQSYMKRRLSLWAEHSGVEVDEHPFSFAGHAYLFPLFSDRSEYIVLMKAAQMGATIYMLLKAFHMALNHAHWGFDHPIKIGFYFPDSKGIGRVVKDRVVPLMKSCNDLRPYSKEQRQDLRPVGKSSLYFLYMGGQSTKDSVPMNALFFDEVRLVKLKEIFQAYARVLHSVPYKYKHHVSTAGFPNRDIHKLFLATDQKWFYTRCQSCNYEQILAMEFPECIVPHTKGPKRGQHYYRCKKCKKEIVNTQRGRYIAHNPGSAKSGYQISQLISRTVTADEIMFEYNNTPDLQEFHNHILGMPFVDKKNKPIEEEDLDNNIDPLAVWGDYIGSNYMGVDQMTNMNYVWILNRQGEKRRVVWFEIIEDRDPWKRTGELLEKFNVETCVIDGLPNSNDALDFANKYPRKVIVAYSNEYNDMVSWEEGRTKKKHKKARPETVAKRRVYLDLYKSIGYTINLIVKRQLMWPDPDKHIIECYPYDGGRKDYYPIMRTHAYPHLSCPIREKVEIEEETGRYRMRWNMSVDPHSLDSLVFAVFASERRTGGFSFSM